MLYTFYTFITYKHVTLSTASSISRYNDKNWQPNELIDQDHGSKQYLCRAARANAKKRNKIHNKVVSNINADHDAGWDTYTECEEVHDDGT